jgi:hypothetical protein
MDAVVNAAEALGWPAETIHVERFGAGPRKDDAPFEAVCKRSGKTVQVGPTEHLLDCLEHAGIEVPFGCRAGSCGTCEVGVLAGRSSIAIRSCPPPSGRKGRNCWPACRAEKEV